jgi:hypothetical protein
MKIKKMNLLWNVEVEEYKAYLDTLTRAKIENLYYDYISRIDIRSQSFTASIRFTILCTIVAIMTAYGLFVKDLCLKVYFTDPKDFYFLFISSSIMLGVFLCILLVLLRIVYLRRINIIKRQEIIKDYLIEKKKERVSC